MQYTDARSSELPHDDGVGAPRSGRNLGGSERLVSLAAGAGLMWLGLRKRAYRAPLMAMGTGLVSRGAMGWCPVKAGVGTWTHRSDTDTRTALGGSHGIRVEECVAINAPVSQVFGFWRNLENLPRFMRHLDSIRSNGRRSHWIAKGPAGVRVEWDAIVINEIEDELIAWRTLEGADVVSAGSVAFEPTGEGSTLVTVTLQYDPPAGKAGAFLARLFGEDPSRQIRSDLNRLKRYFEGRQFWRPGTAAAAERTRGE